MTVTLKTEVELLQQFTEMVCAEVEDEQLDLFYGALLIARTEYPELDLRHYQQSLAQLAERVRMRMGGFSDARSVIAAINHVLFQEERLRGNADDYYDPRNSFLNDVLERKLGIPITLSVLYMEIARRVGLRLLGVGMPGHFLLKHYESDGRETIIDCFNSGAMLSPADCQRRLSEVFDRDAGLQPGHLGAVSRRQILTRMLNNLRNIYVSTRKFRKALPVLDLLLCIYPRSPEDVKQRGVLRYHLNLYRGAIEDFETYVKMAPEASDAAEMRQLALSVRRTMAMMN
jgi:regulator of sirC expression with transglutaminase-like and TPR domain